MIGDGLGLDMFMTLIPTYFADSFCAEIFFYSAFTQILSFHVWDKHCVAALLLVILSCMDRGAFAVPTSVFIRIPASSLCVHASAFVLVTGRAGGPRR